LKDSPRPLPNYFKIARSISWNHPIPKALIESYPAWSHASTWTKNPIKLKIASQKLLVVGGFNPVENY